jgi:hypothetical protein
MSVWVLIAVMHLHEILGGKTSVFIGVYATAAACERDRLTLEESDKGRTDPDARGRVWQCLRQEPKQ